MTHFSRVVEAKLLPKSLKKLNKIQETHKTFVIYIALGTL